MSKRLYPHNRIRYWYTYDLDEICAVYSDLGLHAQTIRKWTKQGLKTIDGGKPALIYGHDLIAHLKQTNSRNKCQTAFDEMYCMVCQDARHIYRTQISIMQAAQFLKVQGVCRECKKRMFKNYKMIDFPKLRQRFTVVDVLELYDDAVPTDKTHIQTQLTVPANESLQEELF